MKYKKSNVSHVHNIKAVGVALILLTLPTVFARPIVRIFGTYVHRSSRIGFSWLHASKIRLDSNINIGHFNFIKVHRFIARSNSAIGSFNWLSGKFSVLLRDQAEIGSRNVITRAPVATEIGLSYLYIGKGSKITAGHKLDMLRSISFGEDSILAGLGSQIWTHSYVHETSGRRFRVDGSISIGNNVYVGSACVFNPGVCVTNNVEIGSNSCVSKDIFLPGLYVSQSLRYIERSYLDRAKRLEPVNLLNLSEPVFLKKKRKLDVS